MKENIRNFTSEELEKRIIAMEEPVHRARQIFLWLNQKGIDNFKGMTNLPKDLIARLEKEFTINAPECVERLKSKDRTEKFLWRLEDGEYIETVLINERARRTVCLSTQVGCKFNCPFCASGENGFTRNLEVSEIVNQLLLVQKHSSLRVTNVVFMGMGEPLDNYDNLAKAIRIINHPKGLGVGARKITVSTCGIVPGILKLKDIGIQVELSISLHAANNALRNELVPINRKYPLGELVKACKEYYEQNKRVITLEYTLIKDKNDSDKDADDLVKLAKELRAKVNLISCNASGANGFNGTNKKRTDIFLNNLQSGGVTATIRQSRGSDILAACGQLAAKRNKK